MLPILLTLFVATSSLPQNVPFIQMMTNQAALELPVSSSTIGALIDFDALYYGVDPNLMRDIIQRESLGNQYAVGDHGTSFGLTQLHDIAQKGITKAEAFNPVFSINYLAEHLAAGQGKMWSTYAAALKDTEELSVNAP